MNLSVSSTQRSSIPIFLWTMHSPSSFKSVCFISPSVGSPYGNVIGSTDTKCFTFHSRALFSGVFLMIETSLLCGNKKERTKNCYKNDSNFKVFDYRIDTYIVVQPEIKQNFSFPIDTMHKRCKSLHPKKFWWIWPLFR